jgi:hypothetical protein
MATHVIKVTLADGMPLSRAEVHHNSGICGGYINGCGQPTTLPVITPHNGIVQIKLEDKEPHVFTINVMEYDAAGKVINVLQKMVTTVLDHTCSGQYMGECRFNL